MKILVTGGAGFIGTNLIEFLVKGGHEVTSIDNYSLGFKSNHIKGAEYIELEVNDISKLDNDYHLVYHLAALSRVQPSFNKPSETFHSNVNGTQKVCEFVRLCNAKLVYAGSSSRHGDPSSSPYAFTKAKNLELLENLKKWFNFKYEIIYFYNVYGPGQIKKGSMATVIGIFEDQFKKKIPLTIVRPGSQSRRFTHVFDTVEGCYFAWKKNMCKHYSVSHKKSYTIIEVAKMFNSKVKFLPSRKGERYASALTSMNLSNKVHKIFGKINLKDYITNIVKNSQKRP